MEAAGTGAPGVLEFKIPFFAVRAGGLSARGVYVNFLDTSKAVFVPQYGLEADLEAIRQIQAAAPGKPVIGIECAEIARYGGALHCVTKNYWLDDISRPASLEPGGAACPGL